MNGWGLRQSCLMNTAQTISPSADQPVDQYMNAVGQAARASATLMAAASTAARNDALLVLARLIRDQAPALQADNAQDVVKAQANGLSDPMVDRLRLTDKVIETMALSCEQVAALPDPVGEMSNLRRRPTGIT